MNSWFRSELLGAAAAGALSVLLVASCSGQTANQPTASSQSVLTPVRAATRPAAAPTGAAGATPSAAAGTPLAAANSTPGASASASISPREVTTGSVTLDLSLEPGRHMFEGGATSSASGTQPQATPQSSGGAASQSASSAVFGGGMVGVANNIDSSQAPPADSTQAIIRHVVVHVRSKSGGQPIPYLSVSLDLLLDGHPVLYDQPLEPMTAVDKNSLRYYYGNNVKFPQRGTYQVFVRIQSSPMLGKNAPPAAQFDVTLR